MLAEHEAGRQAVRGLLEIGAGAGQLSEEERASVIEYASQFVPLLYGHIQKENDVLYPMIRLYCRRHHGPAASLCADCRGLLDYAGLRVERCRFGERKPTCANCPVHCYQSARRQQVKAVMRYAGPRMIWRHPLMSLRHWLDGLRSQPASAPSESINP
jgi:hypothetical protein